MEEFERFREIIRSERDSMFRWMSRSVDLATCFMVPEEEDRDLLGHDGSVNVGLESLQNVVDGDVSISAQ